MKTITIGPNDAGQRLDKFLQKYMPALPVSMMYKYIRKKRVKLNRKKAAPDTKLLEGDILDLYISDETAVESTGLASERQKPFTPCARSWTSHMRTAIF